MVIKTKPQILQRVSIRWLPEPAYEDTDTVALNVGGYFMDLRVVKNDGSVQWSRAGERKTLKDDPLTCQWTRIIDSLGGTEPDEAAFTTLPNGDDLEYGTFNKDGTPTPYEEVWRDVPLEADQGKCAWILQTTDGSGFLGKVGHVFMSMCQGENGSFGVRKEVYHDSTGEWKASFESGPVQGMPHAKQVLQIERLLQGGENAAGDEIEMGLEQYVIRGLAVA